MASTLSLLKLPILKPSKPQETKPKLFNPSNSITPKLNKDSNFPQNQLNGTCQNLYYQEIEPKLNKDSNFLEIQLNTFQNLEYQETKPKPKLNKDSNFLETLLNGTFQNLELSSFSVPLTAATFCFFLDPNEAFAAGGEFGIFEGRTFALIHPIVMGGLFVYTLYAGYLGWQWRRVRTLQDEIGELKKEVKPVPVTPDGKTAAEPPKASPVEIKIQQLTEERKELLKGSYRDKHFNAGSILLGFGVLEAVGGGVNTWLRTGKLFPGPHLFAGAGITVLWALAAALVPAMQKGNDTARSLHIALNAINVVLFIWQIPTGLDIVLKVFEFTKWP